jgi:4-hydroxybenzoate polyprenyltransferase
MIALCVMGCIYNIPPVRSKDRAYVDVLTEAINNPLRMVAGWAMVETQDVIPGSLLLSYWMIGCYFMAIKRYAELREIGSGIAAAYRRSFAVYTETKLLTSIMFYAAAAMLFFGVFVMRYRLELILSFPFVALVMAAYLGIGLEPHSAAQRPERLYRSGKLLGAVCLCTIVMFACLAVDMPWLDGLLAPLAPTR